MMLARVFLLTSVLVLASLTVSPPRTTASTGVVTVASLQPHAPIDVEGDAGFNATNGVVSGNGTPTTPYVIAGWSIATPSSFAVQIRNTKAHAVLRDMWVTLSSVEAFYFFSVSNVTLLNVTAYLNTGEGLRFESSRDVSVLGSTLKMNGVGMVILSSTSVTVRGTNFTINTADGLAVTASPAVTIANNTFVLNGFANAGYGVDLASTTGDVVTGNTFFRDGIFLDGTTVRHFDSHIITPDNVVAGRPILYEKDCVGLALTGLSLGQLLLANCTHASLSNLTIALGVVGIELAYSSTTVVGPNVTIADTATGVRAFQSRALRFVDSELIDTDMGILLESSMSVDLVGLKISSPSSLAVPYDGVAIHGSDTVNLTGTTVRHHRNGVDVESSGNITLFDNLLSLNSANLQAYRSWDLKVLDNLFVHGGNGLLFLNVTNASVSQNAFLGAFLAGANVSGSSGARFSHNTFVGNGNNARDDSAASDAWNATYPTGGNFWGNYAGLDQCSGPLQNLCTGPDGIGDTPYLFPVNAADRYPLMVSPVSRDVPPEALFSLSPPAGNVRTVFSVSANFSSDYEDPLGLLRVRWSWDGGATFGPWSTTKSSRHVYGTPGNYTVRVEVMDTAGLTDNWSWPTYVAPKPDNLPPTIEHTPPTTADVGQPILILANVTDPSGLANLTLLYRGVDDTAFHAVPMGYVNGTNYSAKIPAQAHAGTVAYVIVANDSWGNEARAPLSGYDTVQVVDPVLALLVTVVAPAVIAAAAIVAVYLLWYRKRKSKKRPPEDVRPPPGNP